MARAPLKDMEKAFKDARQRGRLKAFRYVKQDDRGRITGVVCKLCGTPIVVADARGQLRPTAAYEEMTFVCDDGTKHISPVCPCARNADRETMRDAYLADLAQWFLFEGEAGKALVERYARRRPLKVIRRRRSDRVETMEADITPEQPER